MPAAASKTVIDTGETFRIRNDHETEPLDVSLGKRTWHVEPGKTALVPFEIIRIWWGDPRCRTGVFTKFADSKESGYINKREEEIGRLGVLYGTYANDVETLLNPEWPPGDSRYGVEPRRVPHPISVQTEGGDRVIPCCFDLTGEAVYGAVRNDSEDLNDQVVYREHLETRLDEIQAELRSLQGVSDPDDAEVDAGNR